VKILRQRHPLEGRDLEVMGGLRRGGIQLLLIALPDGSRTLVPERWTNWKPNETDCTLASGDEGRERCLSLHSVTDFRKSSTAGSVRLVNNKVDRLFDRGIYNRNACAQLRRVFIYVRQADGHLCPPERDQSDYVGKGQIVARRKAPDPHF
jgi:hypothetical protein